MFDFLDVYPWLLPFIIFFGRICDVSLGTLRIIFVSKGERYKAPIVGFFEVFIWIVVISQVLSRADGLVSYLSYAGGYAAGNFVGILIERRIAFGVILFRVFTQKNGLELTKELNSKGFGSTCIHGQGSVSKVDVVESVFDRKFEKDVDEIVRGFDPNAFYIVEDIRSKQRGIFGRSSSIFRYGRPGK
ncbi:MAG: DUF2179 domain-containing protein [Massilibacteroides sp.]|nr:DUF2179 domain-containing protein [Massilibacteroides sp.]MDD3062547.1 DUF2179 domain-containing protein [Massilibacteroides sp.]MDD4114520.1 DUF2179 domain-containing protein [Massilibacteroides sp.]MDD4659361.1 DUF2179 domain-containing protein [Massilibacteroides sp.]